MHGIGHYKYETGDDYQGEWSHGLMKGKGVYIYATGDIYDGEWHHGVQQGKGKYKYHEKKERYEG